MARLDWKPSQSEVMKQRRADKKAAQATEQVVTSEWLVKRPKATQPKVEKQPDLNSQILERLDRLEKENAELKASKENPFKKAHEKYEWPLAYSYKLRGWVPVLSYVSVMKDPTKDLTFKNQNGILENNQLMRLELANGTTVDVDSIEFGNNFTRSDKMEAKFEHGEVITTENHKYAKEYRFESKEFGEFVVLSQIIN